MLMKSSGFVKVKNWNEYEKSLIYVKIQVFANWMLKRKAEGSFSKVFKVRMMSILNPMGLKTDYTDDFWHQILLKTTVFLNHISYYWQL